MRLTCPSCAAQYEVDAAAIGEAGRMVRCANCGAEWFQAGEPPEASAPPAYTFESVAPADDAPVPSPKVEASEPDEAAPVPPAFAPVAAEDEGEAPKADDPGYRIVDGPAATAPADFLTARRDEGEGPTPVPPRYGETRETEELSRSLVDEPPAKSDAVEVASGGGFSSFVAGFMTAAVLAGIAAGAYFAAPDIVAAVPALAPAMESYVGYVDQGRTVLAALVNG